ncbi:MAG: hypothetical protein ACRD3D_08210 [Terriglobia bacterium]
MKRLLILIVTACMVSGVAPLVKAQDAQANPESLQNGLNEITVPEGTEFKLQLHTSVSSKSSKMGDKVIATLIAPVEVEDIPVLRKGVRVLGHVNEVKGAGRRGRGGYLSVQFDTIEMPNGEKVAILGSLTEIFSSAGDGSLNVGPEGDLKGGGASRKKQLAIFGAPTAAAAAAGGLGPGIAVGVAAGVAALVIPKGKQAVLLAGSLVGMRLDEDVTITLPPGAFNPTGGPGAGASP